MTIEEVGKSNFSWVKTCQRCGSEYVEQIELGKIDIIVYWLVETTMNVWDKLCHINYDKFIMVEWGATFFMI